MSVLYPPKDLPQNISYDLESSYILLCVFHFVALVLVLLRTGYFVITTMGLVAELVGVLFYISVKVGHHDFKIGVSPAPPSRNQVASALLPDDLRFWRGTRQLLPSLRRHSVCS